MRARRSCPFRTEYVVRLDERIDPNLVTLEAILDFVLLLHHKFGLRFLKTGHLPTDLDQLLVDAEEGSFISITNGTYTSPDPQSAHVSTSPLVISPKVAKGCLPPHNGRTGRRARHAKTIMIGATYPKAHRPAPSLRV